VESRYSNNADAIVSHVSPSTPQTHKEAFEEEFTGLTVETVRILDTGWHHDAIEVNGSIIFRVPHHTYGRVITPEKVEREVALLRFLQERVPVDIPSPQYVPRDYAYYGYPKLDGVLVRDLVGDCNADDWQRYREDWVDIASALHGNVNVEQARQLGVPDFVPPSQRRTEGIFDIPDVDEAVTDFARDVIGELDAYDSTPNAYVFIHDDMQAHNLLADPQTKRVTGLIDWTEACLGPLSCEFAVHEWMQGAALSEVARMYEEKTGVPVDQQEARMWYSIAEIGAYVSYFKAGEADEAEKYLQSVRRLIDER
jgi:aminoglycoside phosphotransferase (APT) family kinase protein